MPAQPNVFKLEITPPSPTLDPDKPATMTVKNLATTKQKVIISVESFLFELVEPRGFRVPLTQVYKVLEPGESLSFQIEVTKVLHMKCTEEVMSRMTKPEGKLQFYHQTTTKKTDKHEDWSHDVYEEYDNYYNPPEEWYTATMKLNSEEEWGYVEFELSCEKETKWMKKQKKQFIKMKKSPEEKKKKCIIS